MIINFLCRLKQQDIKTSNLNLITVFLQLYVVFARASVHVIERKGETGVFSKTGKIISANQITKNNRAEYYCNRTDFKLKCLKYSTN